MSQYIYSVYDDSNNVRMKKFAERQKYDNILQERSDNEFDVAIHHKAKETIVEQLMGMFSNKFNVTKEEFFIFVDKYHLLETGVSRENLIKIVKELKLMETYKSNKKIITDEANIEIKVEKDKPEVPAFYAPSQIQQVTEKNIEDNMIPAQLLTEKKTPLIPDKSVYNPIVDNQTYTSSIKSVMTQSIPNNIPTSIQSTLNTYIISYPRNNNQQLESEQKIIYTGAHVSASVCTKYELHNMPYILLVINKKYKIPIEFSKSNDNFYSHKKNKGPIITSSIHIELFDYMNNPLNLSLSPTEIFHILFETTT
jgi:hypothetical protein